MLILLMIFTFIWFAIVFLLNLIFHFLKIWMWELFIILLVINFLTLPINYFISLRLSRFLIKEKIEKSITNIYYNFFCSRILSFFKGAIFGWHRCPKCRHPLIANYWWLFWSKACPDCGFYSNHYLLKLDTGKHWEFIKNNIDIEIPHKGKIYFVWKYNPDFIKSFLGKYNIWFEIITSVVDISSIIEKVVFSETEAIFFDIEFLLKEKIQLSENASKHLNDYIVNDWTIIVLSPNSDFISEDFEYNLWIKIKFARTPISGKCKKNISDSFDFTQAFQVKNQYYWTHKLCFWDRFHDGDYQSILIENDGNSIVSNFDYHNWWFFIVPKELIFWKNADKHFERLIKYLLYLWKIWYLLYQGNTYLENICNEFKEVGVHKKYINLFYYSWDENNESRYYERQMTSFFKETFWTKNILDMDKEYMRYKNRKAEWLAKYKEKWAVNDIEVNIGDKKILVEYKTVKNNGYESVINEYWEKLEGRVIQQKANYWIMILNFNTTNPDIAKRDRLDRIKGNIRYLSYYDFLSLIKKIKESDNEMGIWLLNELEIVT